MNARQVEIHIGEVVLHGFAPGDRAGIGEAIQAEVGRLLAERGLAAPPSSVRVLDGGSIGERRGPADVGRGIGRAVYEGLTR